MNPIRKTLVTTALLVYLPAAFSQGPAIDETLDAPPDARIDISVLQGTVTIRGWDEDRVQVTGTRNAGAEGHTFESTGGVIRFEEDFPRGSRDPFCCDDQDGAQLTFSVPRDSVLDFGGVEVDVDVADLDGDTGINVVEGRITATNLGGQAHLETVNGDIRDSGSSGTRVTYNTIDGDIVSDNSSPVLSVRNVAGRIELQTGPLQELEVTTVDGDVEMTPRLQPGGRASFSSVSGTIHLLIDPALSARLELMTAVGGTITNNLTDDEPARVSRFVDSSELQLMLNDGDGDIEVTTVNGDITLDRRPQ